MTNFLRLPNPFDEEIKGLRRAIDASVIFAPLWMRRNWRFAQWANSLPPAKQSWKADFDSVLSAPKTIRYQQQSAGLMTYPGTGVESWRVELARFAVPRGKVGIVKSYEQFLETTDQTTETWSSIDNWGDPRVPVNGTWFFRLSQFNGLMIPWVNQLNPSTYRVGTPYTDIPDETGLWFPLGGAQSNNVHFVVPGGYVLRLFWEVEATVFEPVVAARLRGYMQSSFSDESRWSVRVNW